MANAGGTVAVIGRPSNGLRARTCVASQ